MSKKTEAAFAAEEAELFASENLPPPPPEVEFAQVAGFISSEILKLGNSCYDPFSSYLLRMQVEGRIIRVEGHTIDADSYNDCSFIFDQCDKEKPWLILPCLWGQKHGLDPADPGERVTSQEILTHIKWWSSVWEKMFADDLARAVRRAKEDLIEQAYHKDR